jgi:hypothetical protein
MKKLLTLITLAVIVTASCFAQQINQSFRNDTTKQTQTKYFTPTRAILIYQGIATWQYTTKHSNATVYTEGSNDASVWWPIDTTAISGSASVNHKRTYILPQYVYYRLRALGTVSDTCMFSNVRFTYKY